MENRLINPESGTATPNANTPLHLQPYTSHHKARHGFNPTPVTAGLTSPAPQQLGRFQPLHLSNSNVANTHPLHPTSVSTNVSTTTPQLEAIEGMKTFVDFIETAGAHAASTVAQSNGSTKAITFASGVDRHTGNKTSLLHEFSESVAVQEGNADAFAALARKKLQWTGEHIIQSTVPHTAGGPSSKSPPSFTAGSAMTNGATTNGPTSSPSASSMTTVESSLSTTPTMPFRFPANMSQQHPPTPPLSGNTQNPAFPPSSSGNNRSPFSITSTKTNFRAEYSSANGQQVFLRPPSPSTLLKPPSPNTILTVIDPRGFNAKLNRESNKAQSPSSTFSTAPTSTGSATAIGRPAAVFLSAPVLERQHSNNAFKNAAVTSGSSNPSPQLSWTATTPNMVASTRVQSAMPSPHTLGGGGASATPQSFRNYFGGGYFKSHLIIQGSATPTDTPPSSNSSTGPLSTFNNRPPSPQIPPTSATPTPSTSVTGATNTNQHLREASGFDARLEAIARVLNNPAIRQMMNVTTHSSDGLSDTEAAHRQPSSEGEEEENETTLDRTEGSADTQPHQLPAANELSPLQILNGLRRIVRLRSSDGEGSQAATAQKPPLLFTLQFPVANRRVNLLSLLPLSDPLLGEVRDLTKAILEFDLMDDTVSGRKRPRRGSSETKVGETCRESNGNGLEENSMSAAAGRLSGGSDHGTSSTITTKRIKPEETNQSSYGAVQPSVEKDPHEDEEESSAAHAVHPKQLAKAISCHIALLAIFAKLVERFAYVIVACLEYPNPSTRGKRARNQSPGQQNSRGSSATPVGPTSGSPGTTLITTATTGTTETPAFDPMIGFHRSSPSLSSNVPPTTTQTRDASNSPNSQLTGAPLSGTSGISSGMLPCFGGYGTQAQDAIPRQPTSGQSVFVSRQQSEVQSFYNTPMLADNRGSSIFYDPEVAAVMSGMMSNDPSTEGRNSNNFSNGKQTFPQKGNEDDKTINHFGPQTTSGAASLNGSSSLPPSLQQQPPREQTLVSLGEGFALNQRTQSQANRVAISTTAQNSLGTSFGLPLLQPLAGNSLEATSHGHFISNTSHTSGSTGGANTASPIPFKGPSSTAGAAALLAARARINSRATTPQMSANNTSGIFVRDNTTTNSANTSALLLPYAGSGSAAVTPMIQPLGPSVLTTSSQPPTPLSRSTIARSFAQPGSNVPMGGARGGILPSPMLTMTETESTFRLQPTPTPPTGETPHSENNDLASTGLALEITSTGCKLVNLSPSNNLASLQNSTSTASSPSPDSPPRSSNKRLLEVSSSDSQQNFSRVSGKTAQQQLNFGEAVSIPTTPQRNIIDPSTAAMLPPSAVVAMGLSPSLLQRSSALATSTNNSFRASTPALMPQTPNQSHHTTPLQCGKYISLESCRLSESQRKDLVRQREAYSALTELSSKKDDTKAYSNRGSGNLLKFSSRTPSAPATPTDAVSKSFIVSPSNPTYLCEEVELWWREHKPMYCIGVGHFSTGTQLPTSAAVPLSNASFGSGTPNSQSQRGIQNVNHNDTLLPLPTTPMLSHSFKKPTPTSTTSSPIAASTLYTPLVFDLISKGREISVPLHEMSQFLTLAIQRIDHLLFEQQVRDQVLAAGFSGPNKGVHSNRGMMEPEA